MDMVCRLCLCDEPNLIPIFYASKCTSELQLQIQNYCSIEITENDALPKMICNCCKDKLTSIDEFKTQCEHSDLKLREYYQIFSPKQTSHSIFEALKDIGIQTDDNIEGNPLLSTNSFFDIHQKEISKVNVTPVSLEMIYSDIAADDDNDNDDDDEDSKKFGCIANGIRSSNSLEVEDCNLRKDNTKVKTRRVRIHTDKVLTGKSVKQPKKKEKFDCNLCQKVYVSKKALLKHTEAHLKSEIVTCNVCNKTFNNSEKLSEHMKKHNDAMDFKCEVCGMPFKERVKLNFHLRVHGKGPLINTDKQYLCDMCSRTFASKSGLRFHLKSHAGNKPYKCKFCSKSFTIPSYKKRHERTHTGDKHFICHICSAAFASANGLKYHLRSHTGEANYHCDTCGKSFRRHKYLKEHTFIHTGEKPFICKMCGSAYGNSGSLFVHERKCKTKHSVGFIDSSKL
ncbi:zinc finger protein 37 homolog [Neodiprion fabricii]|uniref:zinc finger protein 37 homolog n=1 Tax=Neodiprion fabricii TaxID=2872261 RepID=UPI001ED93F52|nr:zinc finger protein 37 homolog [Neodiprion fabricii]